MKKVNKNMNYVYAHYINGELFPFYIGYSKNKNGSYTRAYDMNRRSDGWKKVYKKNKKSISVEILFECSDRIEALNKEYEYINRFGIYTEGGLLVNLSKSIKDGSAVFSDSMREKLRIANLGKKIPRDVVDKVIASRIKSGKHLRARFPVYQYDINGVFINKYDCIKRAAEAISEKVSSLEGYCVREDGYARGFFWKRKFIGHKITVKNKSKYLQKILSVDMLTGMVSLFKNYKEASEVLFYSLAGTSYIKECCLGNRVFYKGYKFCYA